jgi:hypothetical protein
MNERIKLLAEQATTYIEPTSNSGEGWIFDKEKFAQLIVRECANLFDKDEMELTLTERTIHNTIKEHFGVEE